ncbi:MAG: hypothetical protein R3202_01335 [Candidatus Competibacterales bacterium]|nr:hypothetical protein [Candidatus Competibacterales bacterium]
MNTLTYTHALHDVATFIRHLRRFVATALLALLLPSGHAAAGDMSPAGMTAEHSPQMSSILDGMVFAGAIGGEVGETASNASHDDIWRFEQGAFHSQSCKEECGFPANPYWVRFEDDGDIRFKSESRCPVTDAQLVWEGTVSGDRIEGVLTWTKERWYWTIEKQFRFEGRRVDTVSVADGS